MGVDGINGECQVCGPDEFAYLESLDSDLTRSLQCLLSPSSEWVIILAKRHLEWSSRGTKSAIVLNIRAVWISNTWRRIVHTLLVKR